MDGCFTGVGTEEHDGNRFFAAANAIPAMAATDHAVTAFSAANWIGQANGVQVDRSARARNNVDLGNPDDIGGVGNKPYSGGAPNLAPNTTFYGFVAPTNPVGTYGRDVYNVVQTFTNRHVRRCRSEEPAGGLDVGHLPGGGAGDGQQVRLPDHLELRRRHPDRQPLNRLRAPSSALRKGSAAAKGGRNWSSARQGATC